MLIDVTGTPYYLPIQAGENAIEATIRDLTERVALLRSTGVLSDATLHEYYGAKRYEQIAESNAIKGSTLSVGETELAVMKGITISGHDPAYSRDAQSLAEALNELTKMARDKTPTDIDQVKRLNEIIIRGRSGAGDFRTSEVRVRGSRHVPPRTWREIMDQMEQWESWSRTNHAAPPVLRATVLHAWLEHIHPFLDGNGRTGRAITNLELVRAGYPPIIIRRKDRDPYLDALARADDADLGAFIDIIAGRLEDSFRDLERAAHRQQDYDVQRTRYRLAQNNRLAVWNAGVHLLFENIKSNLSNVFDDVEMREYDQLSVDDFIDLCEGRPVRLSWAFAIRCKAPGMPAIERLAWTGVMGETLRTRVGHAPSRPALMWSVLNPVSFPRWIRADAASSPGGEQMTIHNDRWLVERAGSILELSPSDLATGIANEISDWTIPPPTL
jgi:Fic family protein